MNERDGLELRLRVRTATIQECVEIVEAEPIKELREMGRGELRVISCKLLKQRIADKLKKLI